MRFGNRAAQETATTGTVDAVVLGAALAKHQTFGAAGIQNGDIVPYVIEDGDDFEIGTSPFSPTGSGSLTFRTVTESSNGGSRLNLSGSAIVFIDAPASFFNASDNYGSITDAATATDNYGSIT